MKPTYVDPATGYRYHCADQVLRLHRILALRDLGLPLAETGDLLDDAVTAEQLRGARRAAACTPACTPRWHSTE